MIGGDKTRSGQPAVDEAMNHVLAAERDARQAVAECRAEAARLVAEAEARARALAGRSEARIKLAHRVADAAIARALAELAEVPPVSDLDRAAEGDLDRAAAIPEPLASSLETLVTEILGVTP
jgi:regulator of protease activity HflC (stomatin/prohibitin superfamily)